MIEITLPGVHSDILGSYDNGLGAINLAIGHKYLSKLGTPLADVPPELMTDDFALMIHDSRGNPLVDLTDGLSSILTGNDHRIIYHGKNSARALNHSSARKAA